RLDEEIDFLAVAVAGHGAVEIDVVAGHAAVPIDDILMANIEDARDVTDLLIVHAALADGAVGADLLFEFAQIKEQALLRRAGADFYHRPAAQDIFLDRRFYPPDGIGRKPESFLGIEALDCLHHADIAFGDQLAHRQPVTAVFEGDLRHQPQMAGHQPVRRADIALLKP